MLKTDKKGRVFTGFYDIKGDKVYLNDILLLPSEPYANVIMVGYDKVNKKFIGNGGVTPNPEDQRVFNSDIFKQCINTRK